MGFFAKAAQAVNQHNNQQQSLYIFMQVGNLVFYAQSTVAVISGWIFMQVQNGNKIKQWIQSTVPQLPIFYQLD